MIAILLRYTILLLLTALVLAGMSFMLVYLFPGDAVSNLTGIVPATEQERSLLSAQYKLDQSYLAQFGYYLGQLLNGNWGLSFISGQPLRDEVGLALPATIELSAYAMFLSLLIGLPLGCYSGIRAYTRADFSLNTMSIVSISIPVFFLALLCILLFSLQLGWFPLSGRLSLLFDVEPRTGFIIVDIILAENINRTLALKDALGHIILPTLSITIISTAALLRIVRRSVIDVLNRPYIAAARSRGLSRWQIFLRHVLRNALLPILPLMAMQLTTLITNAIIVETLFSWPGIGNWLIQAIYQRDYPALRVGMLVVSILVVVLTISIDLFNRLIDPTRERFDNASL